METIYLGGGCFWCVEAVYRRIEGVIDLHSGYMGGQSVDPTYEEVCSGHSGHVEVVELLYDPARVTCAHLLEVFWLLHDPTSLDAQGADIGSQYRSVIYTTTEEQRRIAYASREEAQGRYRDPIVSVIAPAQRFYIAESYHQDYYDRHPYQGYCHLIITPKIIKLQEFLSQTTKK